ncbi:MAG TPA: CvpA family protein [Saprospiraceae bacterium]|nr:CvpA family protein [Saprospiraceae bacterium]
MVIDIIFFISAAYGFYVGYNKGIIKTVFSTLSIILGLMAAMKFSPYMTSFLEDTFSKSPLMFIAGFVVTFVGVMLLVRLLAKTVEGIFKTIKINAINKVAGGILMSGFFILLFSILVWFGNESRVIDTKTKESSFSYAYLEKIPVEARGLFMTMKPVFKDFWNYTLDYMDRIKRAGLEEEQDTNIHDVPKSE